MSDTDRDSAVRVLVFVSDGGTTVGIGKEDAEGMVGVCLATLEAPVTLPEWLQEATVLPPLAGGPVGEA